jgi:hypothetical protein
VTLPAESGMAFILVLNLIDGQLTLYIAHRSGQMSGDEQRGIGYFPTLMERRGPERRNLLAHPMERSAIPPQVDPPGRE